MGTYSDPNYNPINNPGERRLVVETLSMQHDSGRTVFRATEQRLYMTDENTLEEAQLRQRGLRTLMSKIKRFRLLDPETDARLSVADGQDLLIDDGKGFWAITPEGLEIVLYSLGRLLQRKEDNATKAGLRDQYKAEIISLREAAQDFATRTEAIAEDNEAADQYATDARAAADEIQNQYEIAIAEAKDPNVYEDARDESQNQLELAEAAYNAAEAL